MDKPLRLNFLDHVAITVKDVGKSVEWYEKTIGLKKLTTQEWGEFPVMLVVRKSGIAIFPSEGESKNFSLHKTALRIKHFAFNVDNTNFENAQRRFLARGIPFEIQDHYYFNSIYIQDLDGHIVELTTLKNGFKYFYN